MIRCGLPVEVAPDTLLNLRSKLLWQVFSATQFTSTRHLNPSPQPVTSTLHLNPSPQPGYFFGAI
jgi:hypothetical protein